MATTIPQGDYGIASVQTDAYQDIELFAGDTPAVVTMSYTASSDLVTEYAGATLPAWSPVHVTIAGAVETATFSTSKPANAITVFPIIPEEGGKISVYRAGMFNPEAINWVALSDVDAPYAEQSEQVRGQLTNMAFANASDHQIYFKAPFYGRA